MKNPYAFPIEHFGIAANTPGMTMRDYFAANAMNAALMTAKNVGSPSETIDFCAKHAYLVADAMLRARDAK